MAEKLIRSLDDQPTKKTSSGSPMMPIIIVIALVLGIGTGFLFSKIRTKTTTTAKGTTTASNGKKSAGIADKKAYPDSAEGILREGGIEGEGSFHLERPGGTSQNVYLTSSTVDLSEYIGKKVQVMGQTFDSEKAGWLMDVGFVEVQ